MTTVPIFPILKKTEVKVFSARNRQQTYVQTALTDVVFID